MLNSLRLEEALDAMYRDLDYYTNVEPWPSRAAEVEHAIADFKERYRNMLYPNGRS